MELYEFKINIIFNLHTRQIDMSERRSRRDMSPQGRKRVAGMVSRDYQTVSGIGGSTQYQVRINCFCNFRIDKILFISHSLMYNEEEKQFR